MPELPEVETVCRGLDRVMTGQTIARVTQNRPNLRFPFPPNFETSLAGTTVKRISRRAKYILIDLDSGQTLLVHLGMSGRFEIIEPGNNSTSKTLSYGKHAHVILHMKNGTDIVYHDPRRFGFMDLLASGSHDAHPRLKTLGIEPLGNELNSDVMAQAFRSKQRSLKAMLMDQKIIAGIGNIYACEALYRAGLSPRRAAADLGLSSRTAHTRAENLVLAIRNVLNDAIAAGGSTLRDHRQVDGDLGYFQHSFSVYGREGKPCHGKDCSGIIKRIVQNNRSTFFCPSCQK